MIKKNWFSRRKTFDTNKQMNDANKWMYVPYNKGIFNNFKITVIGESYCGTSAGYRMDVDQIELFGTIYPINYINPNKISLQCKSRSQRNSIYDFAF